jgi:hypothetical protein
MPRIDRCSMGYDTVGIAPLIDQIAFAGLIADLNGCGAKIVISQKPRRNSPSAIDDELYKWRHLIENVFGKLKDFKRTQISGRGPGQLKVPFTEPGAGPIDLTP